MDLTVNVNNALDLFVLEAFGSNPIPNAYSKTPTLLVLCWSRECVVTDPRFDAEHRRKMNTVYSDPSCNTGLSGGVITARCAGHFGGGGRGWSRFT